MSKIIPLVSLTVAACFAYHAASQFPTAAIAVGGGNPARTRPKARPASDPAKSRPAATGQRSHEPAHKALIRCLGDLDNLLDTIQGPISFAAVKPKLLARVRQHAAEAADHPNPGMARLSPSAATELQRAMNRHTQSLSLAIQAAPEVKEFFEKEIAAVLTPK